MSHIVYRTVINFLPCLNNILLLCNVNIDKERSMV